MTTTRDGNDGALVERLMGEGVREGQLCFYTGANNATYNHAACATNSYKVFGSNGMTYTKPPASANDAFSTEAEAEVVVGRWG